MDTERPMTGGAGKQLAQHPEHLHRGTWENITVESTASGLGPHQSRTDHYTITVQGGVPSTIPGYDLPFGTRFSTERAEAIAKFIHGWQYRWDEEKPWHVEFLEKPGIELVEQADHYFRFKFSIKHPYLD